MMSHALPASPDIDRWVERIVAEAPPLTLARRDQLAALLGCPAEVRADQAA